MERFYSKVNPMVHNSNLLKDSIILEEKAEAYQLKKALRLKENDIRIKAVRAKYVRELRASRAAEEAEVCVAPTDGVLIVEDLPEVPKRDTATPKNWNKRPQYWESIVEYYVESSHSIDAVLQLYDKEFLGYNSTQADRNIIPIYVPAGCTDVIQECDTIINAPFKKVMRACFRDHLYAESSGKWSL
jgi:hypothetical protein